MEEGKHELIKKDVYDVAVIEDMPDLSSVIRFWNNQSGRCSFEYDSASGFKVHMDEDAREKEENDFIEAEFVEELDDDTKSYYKAAAVCGIVTGVLGEIFSLLKIEFPNAGNQMSEEEKKDFKGKTLDKLKEQDLAKIVIAGAKLAGCKKSNYKESVLYLMNTFVTAIRNLLPGDVVENRYHYLAELSSHPSYVGLVFSLITQYTGQKYTFGGKEKIVAKNVPKYYVIGEDDCEKTICAFIYWLFSIVAAKTASAVPELIGEKLDKRILDVVNELAKIPPFNKIPSDYADYEKGLSGILKGIITKNKVGNLITTAVLVKAEQLLHDVIKPSKIYPLLLNEGLVRCVYVAKKTVFCCRNQRIETFDDLRAIDINEIFPETNTVLDNMSLIASGCFTAVNISGAVLKALAENKLKGKPFLKALISEVNIPGVGRFLFAIGKAGINWENQGQAFFERKWEWVDREPEPVENDTEALKYLELDLRQLQLLHNFEYYAVKYDIQMTKKDKDRELKQYWLNIWKKRTIIEMPGQNSYFVDDEDSAYKLIRRLAEDKKNEHWMYILAVELMMFKPYIPLGIKEDKRFKKLTYDRSYVEERFVQLATVLAPAEPAYIKGLYDRYTKILNGSGVKKTVIAAAGIGGAAAAGAAALWFAPAIAVAIAGEAVAGLHGAALTSASLAYVGFGSIASGGLGMAGGTAIITGSGTLLGLAGAAGSANAMSLLYQAPKEFLVHQQAEFLTCADFVAAGKYRDVHTIQAFTSAIEYSRQEAQLKLEKLKEEDNTLDKPIITRLKSYISLLEKTIQSLKEILKKIDK